MHANKYLLLLLIFWSATLAAQRLPIQTWTTSPDGVNLLYEQSQAFAPGKDERFPVVAVDTTQIFQTVDGFGYTLTGGSAFLLSQMTPHARATLLQELFGNTDNSLKISFLRISMGASDLDEAVFSYNDLPPGQTDPGLEKFSLAKDTLHLVPLLKEILALSPALKILATPWSPPLWMKTNHHSVGGELKPEYYPSYAAYFVKYIQSMAAQGIAIHAVTIQNEPQHGENNPSLTMTATQQATFIKNHLGPAFQSAGIRTKIIVWDHNCDHPEYPIAILDDPGAKVFVDGSAFHLYAGDATALSVVHDQHPDKNLYFTEQWTGATGSFGGDLQWHIKHVIIGTMRNHSRCALEWNLASDPDFGPHTPGGCTQCKGAITLSGSTVTRNVGYYIIAHAARFVPPGSVRIASSQLPRLHNVTFLTPEGKKVMVAVNDSDQQLSFNIHNGNKWMVTTLSAGHVTTIVW